jgi:glycosyltransferase involved in cell wall biosynthesis
LTWLVPDIEGLPTGGNVYNRRILEALPEDVPATITTWPVGDAAPVPSSPEVDTGGPVVVDSLCLQQAGALRDLREAHPDVRLVLLAHYLHCVDPRKTGSPAANAERDLLPLFDRAVTPSRYVADALSDEGLPAEPVSPGLNAAYREPTVPPPATSGTAPQLLTVANVLPGKGLDVLLDALETLHDLDWTWRLVGSGELDAECADTFRDRLANPGLGDRVRWDGPVPGDAMPGVYDACDVFVLPTRFETCSLSTREAMARGRPVVASRVGGLPENFGDAPAGRLVPEGDAQALAEALADLIADAEARRTMGRAARRQSQSFPTWEASARRFVAACQE